MVESFIFERPDGPFGKRCTWVKDLPKQCTHSYKKVIEGAEAAACGCNKDPAVTTEPIFANLKTERKVKGRIRSKNKEQTTAESEKKYCQNKVTAKNLTDEEGHVATEKLNQKTPKKLDER